MAGRLACHTLPGALAAAGAPCVRRIVPPRVHRGDGRHHASDAPVRHGGQRRLHSPACTRGSWPAAPPSWMPSITRWRPAVSRGWPRRTAEASAAWGSSFPDNRSTKASIALASSHWSSRRRRRPAGVSGRRRHATKARQTTGASHSPHRVQKPSSGCEGGATGGATGSGGSWLPCWPSTQASWEALHERQLRSSMMLIGRAPAWSS